MNSLKSRYSAVLMSVSSLPSPYGIGGFGNEFNSFVDFLKVCGFSTLQVLPFTLPDNGNSPYGSCSAFAGNYLYIDPLKLYETGLITKAELDNAKYNGSPFTVDYNFVFNSKQKLLKSAYARVGNDLKNKLLNFAQKNTWVNDYALYMAIKNSYNGLPWQKWESKYKDYNSAVLLVNEFENDINYFLFEQYIFSLQYNEVKEYANKNGIKIIGDIPIYVSSDSVDVWKNPNLFCLNDEYIPLEVAGVPPDAFSAEGQLWGNPVYNWPQHKNENYEWWLSRLNRTFELYDIVRIDHFRAFASYYTVGANATDAKNGVWKKGPNMDLFDKIFECFESEKFIAEDLGTYGDDVVELLKNTKIPGMRVVQFGFEGGNSTHLPHNYRENCVAYIGTHDNNTLLGWLWELDENRRQTVLNYCSFNGDDWGKGGYKSESCRAVIETVMKSPASLVVIPFQDLCGFGSDARMNIPGVPKDNWRFRTTYDTINGVDTAYFKFINKLFFRT